MNHTGHKDLASLSKPEREKYLSELLDPNKTYVYCGIHGYFGSNKPPETRGCSKCWFAYYFYDMATTPPDRRYERMKELEMVVHHLAESEDKGVWDFKPLLKPEWTIERDVPDEEVNRILNDEN